MANMLEDLILSPRKVTSNWHLRQVQYWLQFDQGRELDTVLVYASVELRASIERLLFELLYLINDCQISRVEEAKCRSIGGIFSLIKKKDPLYRKTIQFSVLLSSISPEIPRLSEINTQYLDRSWHELSEYCHMNLRPNESFETLNKDFQHKGFKLLREVYNKLMQWSSNKYLGIINKSSMPSEVASIYFDFANDKIDLEQAKRMLILIEPVLKQRAIN